jgi:hypothetical protein
MKVNDDFLNFARNISLIEEVPIANETSKLGFKIIVCTLDYGIPHAHIVSYKKKNLAKFIITDNPPITWRDIIQHEKTGCEITIDNKMKKIIFNFFNKHKWGDLKEIWNNLKETWNNANYESLNFIECSTA